MRGGVGVVIIMSGAAVCIVYVPSIKIKLESMVLF